MPKFSFIVPVYGVEEFLPKCVDSMLAQTYEDFEILLIDDESPDRCGQICDDYAARYPRKVRSYHQKNGGSGMARNYGISLSEGEYLIFVDSDDYISSDLLADLHAAMEKQPAELYLFGAVVERDGKQIGVLDPDVPVEQPFTVDQHPELFFGATAPWGRAYHRSFFAPETGISFPPKVWYQDIRVVTKIFVKAKSIVRIPKRYYHYVHREGSATINKNAKRNVEILYAFEDILGWFREHGYYERYEKELEFLTIHHVFLAASVRVIRIDRKHPLIVMFYKYTQKEFPNFRQCAYLPTLDKNKSLIFKLLLKKRYRSVLAIFKLKELLGK
ncbi:MAG: glycosyltransferase [Oscillospiraceae bacterium]|nr:glycosyltransferase [Oscillospiraceae bacterium]